VLTDMPWRALIKLMREFWWTISSN
jgi:hypothetical protein